MAPVESLPASGRPLGEFWADARTLSREAFLATFPDPVLLELAGPPDAALRQFETMVVEARANITHAGAGADPDAGVGPESRVFAIRKCTRMFPGKITVGRTTNNDLILREGRVSKLHAWFVREGETCTLVDAESSNGTFVNGTRLAPLGRADLKPRDQVAFGSQARFVYVPAAQFFRRAPFLVKGGPR